MKNLLTSFAFLLFFAGSVHAQVCWDKNHRYGLGSEELKWCPGGFEWLSPVYAADGPGVGYFVAKQAFLVPDTGMVMVQKDSGLLGQYVHSVGIVIDPYDENFELVNDGNRQNRWDEVCYDSIGFPYIYVRNIDSTIIRNQKVEVVDTLILQMYRRSTLYVGSFRDLSGNTILYGKSQKFDTNSLEYKVASTTVKIPLTSADSTYFPDSLGWKTKMLFARLPDSIGRDVPSPGNDHNNIFGFSIAFKQMVKPKAGDTLQARNGDSVHHPMNYFGYTHVTNEATQILQTKYINNSFFTNSTMRHGKISNGWLNNAPGNAYPNHWYWLAFIRASVATNVTEQRMQSEVQAIYPSPAKDVINVELNLDKMSEIELQLYDLQGRQVASEKPTSNIGETVHSLNIPDVTSGIYLLHLRVNGSTIVKRVVVE